MTAPPTDQQIAIGVARLREHFLNHAEMIFRRVLATSPDHPVALHYLGVTLCRLGRWVDGLGSLAAAAALAPNNAAAATDLASALTGPGAAFSTDLAIHAFKVIDYPYRSQVRYGSGRPSHPGLAARIAAGVPKYQAVLEGISEIAHDFSDIPAGGGYEGQAPFWLNAWFPPLDGLVLTQMLRDLNPAQFVEIGSGVSTKFARRAVAKYGLQTRLTSIDPKPRNEIDALCDVVLRLPLEECPLEIFTTLNVGDVLFLDSSHRSFQGSDVTAFFMDILPQLKPGVIVQIHDVYLPDDYISGHVARLWNEQYLLATALLFGPERFEILFPCWYAYQDEALNAQAKAALAGSTAGDLNLYGASFWMRVR